MMSKITIKFRFSFYSLLIFSLPIFWAACNSSSTDQSASQQQTEQTGDPIVDALSSQIAQEPDVADHYFQRAQALYQREAYDEAITDMEQAMALDSTNIDYYHFLADVYLDYFRSRKALETLYKAINLYPERIPTLLKLSEFQMIVEQYEQGLATTRRILKIDPLNAEAYFMQGLIQENKGDTAMALDAYLKAGENDPQLIDAWINLGNLLDAVQDPRAEQYFDNALRVDSTNLAALLGKGNFYYTQGELEKALEMFEKIKAIDRQYPHAYFNSGLIYLEMEEPDKAYDQFDQTVRVSPLYRAAYYYRGRSSEMRGDLETARIDYQNALKSGGSYPAAEEALADLELLLKQQEQ